MIFSSFLIFFFPVCHHVSKQCNKGERFLDLPLLDPGKYSGSSLLLNIGVIEPCFVVDFSNLDEMKIEHVTF